MSLGCWNLLHHHKSMLLACMSENGISLGDPGELIVVFCWLCWCVSVDLCCSSVLAVHSRSNQTSFVCKKYMFLKYLANLAVLRRELLLKYDLYFAFFAFYDLGIILHFTPDLHCHYFNCKSYEIISRGMLHQEAGKL